MKAIAFAAPHTNISGGIKAICCLAQLCGEHYKTSVIFNHLSDPQLRWLFEAGRFNFSVVQRSPQAYRDVSLLVEFMDNTIDASINIPRVLFMQGLSETMKEHNNLMFPFKAVIATSRWLADRAKACGHKNVIVVPPGLQEMFLNRGEKVFYDHVIIGSLYHRFALKNTNAFAYAMAKIALELDPTKSQTNFLLLASSVNDADRQKYPIKCEWHIAPPQGSLPVIYSKCAVWVSPSLREGWGLTTVEAMACGVPTIWVRSSGLNDLMVDGENCLIVEQKDISDIGSKVLRLKADRSLAKKLSLNGQKTVQQFTWKRCFEAFNSVVGSMLK